MDFSETITYIAETLCYLACCFAIFFLGKLFYQVLNRSFNVKKELVEEDNFAFAVAHVGYLAGLLIAIAGVIVGPSKGLLQDVTDIAIYGVLAIVLLNVSIWINDKVILRKFSVKKEILTDRNVGTGVVEGAVACASGLIIYGAIVGESENLLMGIVSTLAFWAGAQLVLFLASIAYQWITPYDFHEHIEKDNVAVGLGLAGIIIAISIIITHAIQGNTPSSIEQAYDIGIELLLGFLLLPLLRLLTDKILLPGQKLTDEIINQEKPNIGAGLIEAFSYIGGALLLTWCL